MQLLFLSADVSGKICVSIMQNFKEMWEHISKETKTYWELKVEEVHLSKWEMEPDDYVWMGLKSLVFISPLHVVKK